MTEEPTQQIRLRSDPASAGPTTSKQVTPPLPPGLDPRGRSRDERHDPGTEPTGVLHLDELFATETDTDRHVDRPAIEDAPTWTAMPVVPVRSEPYPPATAAPAPTAPATAPPHPTGPPIAAKPPRTNGGAARAKAISGTTARRLSTDLAAAKRRTGVILMRTDTWLHRDDNALMVLTALIACMLILLVAAVGH